MIKWIRTSRLSIKNSLSQTCSGTTYSVYSTYPVYSTHSGYRGTSPIRNTPLLGPYSRTMPRAMVALGWGGLFSMSEVTLYSTPIDRRHARGERAVAAAVLFTSIGAHQPSAPRERELFIENLLARIHLIIEMILVDRPCAQRLSRMRNYLCLNTVHFLCEVRCNAVHATRGERLQSSSPLSVHPQP